MVLKIIYYCHYLFILIKDLRHKKELCFVPSSDAELPAYQAVISSVLLHDPCGQHQAYRAVPSRTGPSWHSAVLPANKQEKDSISLRCCAARLITPTLKVKAELRVIFQPSWCIIFIILALCISP